VKTFFSVSFNGKSDILFMYSYVRQAVQDCKVFGQIYHETMDLRVNDAIFILWRINYLSNSLSTRHGQFNMLMSRLSDHLK